MRTSTSMRSHNQHSYSENEKCKLISERTEKRRKKEKNNQKLQQVDWGDCNLFGIWANEENEMWIRISRKLWFDIYIYIIC